MINYTTNMLTEVEREAMLKAEENPQKTQRNSDERLEEKREKREGRGGVKAKEEKKYGRGTKRER